MSEQEKKRPKRRYRRAAGFPCCLSVRVTKSEREILRNTAGEAGVSLSRYLARSVIEGRYPPTLEERDLVFRLRFLLEKAGTNLNQIAHRLNLRAKGAPVPEPTPIEIQQAVRVVRELAGELRRRIG